MGRGIAGGCSDLPPQGSGPGGPLECSRWPVDPWPGEQPGLSPEGLRRRFPSLPHILYCILLTMAGLVSFLLLETSSTARYHPRRMEDGEWDPKGKRRASPGDKIMGQGLLGGHRESPEELESPWTRESYRSQDRLWGSSSPLGCGSWSALGELQSVTQDHRGGPRVICALWGLPPTSSPAAWEPHLLFVFTVPEAGSSTLQEKRVVKSTRVCPSLEAS